MSKIFINGRAVPIPTLKEDWNSPLPVTRKDASIIMRNAIDVLHEPLFTDKEAHDTFNRFRTALIAMGLSICEIVERGYKPELKEFAVTISVPSSVVVYKEAATEEEARKLVESGLAKGQTIQKVEEFK